MKRAYLIIISILLLCFPTIKAEENIEILIERAVYLMDNGSYDESNDILVGILKENPDNYTANYELAYLHYLKKEYDIAAKMYGKLIDNSKATEMTHIMYGNSLDLLGQKEEARNAYNNGLKKYPNSGRFPLEIGMSYQLEKRYNEAVNNYELGILTDPSFISNYFRATLIYLNSHEPVWGMMYGEIMANMNPTPDRFKIISKMLYNTYKQNIKWESKKKMTTTFTKNNVVSMDTISKTINIPFPCIFELVLSKVLPMHIKDNEINLTNLCTIRKEFVENYYGIDNRTKKKNDDKPSDNSKICNNVLMEYLKKVLDNGHMEAYNMWLFQEADLTLFNIWTSEHQKQYSDFLNWHSNNPIEINKENCFVRGHNSDGVLITP